MKIRAVGGLGRKGIVSGIGGRTEDEGCCQTDGEATSRDGDIPGKGKEGDNPRT